MSVAPPAKKRLLCVDSHEDTSELLITLLSNYEVTPASTIADGLRLARSDRFDLILLDQRLPDGQGSELCCHIREFKPRTPILFFSGAAYEADRQGGMAAGAQEFLVKPGDLDILEPTIARLIHHAEACAAG
jgi:DNA-binding response OmpR family regulator